jgi:hypothetical protein
MVSLVFGDYSYINYKDIVGRIPKVVKKAVRCEENFSNWLIKKKEESNINKQNYFKIITVEAMSYYFERIKKIVTVYSHAKYKIGNFSGEYDFEYRREQWEEMKNDYKNGIDKLVELHNLLITLLDEKELTYYKKLINKMLLMIKTTKDHVEGLDENKLEIFSRFVEGDYYEKLFKIEAEGKFSKVLLSYEQLNENFDYGLKNLKIKHKELLDTFGRFLENYKMFANDVYLTEYDTLIKDYGQNRTRLANTVKVLDKIYMVIDDNFSKLCSIYDGLYRLRRGGISEKRALDKLNNVTEALKSSYDEFIAFKYNDFLRTLLYNYMEYKEKLIVFVVDKAFYFYKINKQIEDNDDIRFWFVTLYRDNLTVLVKKIVNMKNVCDEKCNKDEYL